MKRLFFAAVFVAGYSCAVAEEKQIPASALNRAGMASDVEPTACLTAQEIDGLVSMQQAKAAFQQLSSMPTVVSASAKIQAMIERSKSSHAEPNK